MFQLKTIKCNTNEYGFNVVVDFPHLVEPLKFSYIFLKQQQIKILHTTATPSCGIHVFRTPLSPSEIFFLGKGKPAWILESDG